MFCPVEQCGCFQSRGKEGRGVVGERGLGGGGGGREGGRERGRGSGGGGEEGEREREWRREGERERGREGDSGFMPIRGRRVVTLRERESMCLSEGGLCQG